MLLVFRSRDRWHVSSILARCIKERIGEFGSFSIVVIGLVYQFQQSAIPELSECITNRLELVFVYIFGHSIIQPSCDRNSLPVHPILPKEVANARRGILIL